MFLKRYLNAFYYQEVLDNYSNEYLDMLDEDSFRIIYELFKKYNFYYIDDIILNYLELFFMSSSEVEKGILKLKQLLGNSFVYIIGNDMMYLDNIIREKA